MKLKEIVRLTGLPIFIASLCCVAPIVIVLLGLGSISFAAYLTNILERKYQWIFILSGILFLSASLLLYFRNRGICTLDQAVKHRNEIINKSVIVFLTALIGYIIFFYIILGNIGRI